MAKAKAKKVAAKTVSKKPAGKAPPKGGERKLLEQVLQVSGAGANDVRELLADTRGTASGLRVKIADALKDEIAAGTLPGWLKVEDEVLETIVHLGSPMFTAKGADADEWFGDPPEEDTLVWQKGNGWHRGADGEEEERKIADKDVASIGAYETSGELLLTNITWRETPLKTKKEFAALMKKAEDAFFGEMTAYDAGDHVTDDESDDSADDAPPASGGESAGAIPGAYALGGPERNAHYEGSFGKEPKILWARAEFDSSGDERGGSVVVGDGIAVGAKSGFTCKVAALDAASGETRWKIETAKTQCWPASGIAIANRVVYMATNHGLHALDARSGKALWLAKLSGCTGAPLLVGETAIIGAKKGVYGLSLAKNGRKAWTFALKDQAGGAIAYRDGVIYFYGDDHLIALDAAGGKKPLWKAKGGGYIPSTRTGPIVTADSVIFRGDMAGEIACVDRSNGKPRWLIETDGIGNHPAAVSDELLVIKDDQGIVRAYDLAKGKERWHSDAGQKKPYGIGCCGPVIAGNTVVCITVEDNGPHRLCGFDLATGKVLWRIESAKIGDAIAAEQKKTGSSFDGSWNWYSTPFVANGVLYAQADAGIVALR